MSDLANNEQLVIIERLNRDEFVHEVFAPHYEPGEHVALVGPTNSGKTTIAYQMLNCVASPSLPAVILVMKPRDQVVVDWSKLSGFKKTETWPPVMKRGFKKKSGGFMKKRRGWVFWPKHSLSDIKRDNDYLSEQFELALTECYKKGDRIVFADDILGLTKELNLTHILEAIWSRGRSMECGLWAAAQRPFHAPLMMYDQSAHLILFNDPDKRSVERFKEIGGVNPDQVGYAVRNLKKHEFLYIGRTMGQDEMSAALAIVEAK